MMAVALLAEGVDRNIGKLAENEDPMESPSSRRAWIEICPHGKGTDLSASPSSRRAWIEICKPCPCRHSGRVALLAEGVDRNCNYDCYYFS